MICIVAVAIVVATGLALLSSGLGPARPGADTSSAALLSRGACLDCNVLLITIETLRADHLKCQGYEDDIAPNICAFGKKGLLFENAYTPAPVTMPALRPVSGPRPFSW